MFSFFYNNLLWTEGLFIAIALGAFILCGLLLYRPLVYVGLFLLLGAFFFFRNPERSCPQALFDDRVLVCPADGTIVSVQHGATGELAGFEQKVSIFLSVFDAHVQWVPMAGNVREIVYTPGTFTMAFLPKSSLLNEHNDVTIAGDEGKTILVRQIAGTIARRIVCWVSVGDSVSVGQKFGMIKFGSRIDVFLPAAVKLEVGIGQRVYGGQTVLGRWQ